MTARGGQVEFDDKIVMTTRSASVNTVKVLLQVSGDPDAIIGRFRDQERSMNVRLVKVERLFAVCHCASVNVGRLITASLLVYALHIIN
jgi:hypothetical protein